MSTPTLKNFINNSYVDANAKDALDLVDPATEEVYAHAPISSEADVDSAYKAAAEAFDSWKNTTPGERQLALFRIADEMESRAETLSITMQHKMTNMETWLNRLFVSDLNLLSSI